MAYLDGKKPGDIKNVESEAGIIASIILKPNLTFFSEQLRPQHFTDCQNGYIYYAVTELAKRGVEKIDTYAIFNELNKRSSTERFAQTMSPQAIEDFIDVAPMIARDAPEDYRVLVDNVLEAAFRRNTYEKLVECERLCFNSNEQDIEHKIYEALDGVMMEFSTTNEVPQYKDVIDELWHQIEVRQAPGGVAGYPFPFPTLNQYVQMERGELVIFGAEAKQGKSMMLLNIAADLLKRGARVLYLDSELNSRLFTVRLISHLTGIEFARVRSGRYEAGDREKIAEAIEFLKTRSFTHLYMPVFDEQSIYTTIKKVYHQQGLDVIIVDYFKGSGEHEAFASYQALGGLVDMIKNKVCGDMNLVGVGAAQATSTGRLADSAKIARNASTIVMIQDKSLDEMTRDGSDCGNKKLFVRFNRNGAQMVEDEYIDMQFDGNRILYSEAKQHCPVEPY